MIRNTFVPSQAAGAYAASQRLQAPQLPAKTESFADLLGRAVGGIAESGQKAEALTRQVASGQKPEFTAVVTAVAESEAALETLVAVRDKVIQAYEEILRMPI
ncbi:MAG: flagellar hook-basal body complex protein FliE [Proteobacteria bacterium]|nr:flagellar hook-basal body complex protein FliE [Pseudomonadota bacterium]